jgi:hypothetical protein
LHQSSRWARSLLSPRGFARAKSASQPHKGDSRCIMCFLIMVVMFPGTHGARFAADWAAAKGEWRRGVGPTKKAGMIVRAAGVCGDNLVSAARTAAALAGEPTVQERLPRDGRWYVLAAAQHIDQNVSVAALDDLAEMGLSRARGVPRLVELAGSTPRLLPYIRVRLVLIDKEIVDARRAHRPCLHHRANSSTSSRASSSRY